MPRFSKHNDAVRYDIRMKYTSFTKETLNNLCDKLIKTSGYRMIVWDSYGSTFNKDAIVKINVEGEWNK